MPSFQITYRMPSGKLGKFKVEAFCESDAVKVARARVAAPILSVKSA